MDKPLDGRSDLFSLGVVLWELLAGRYMHRGNEEAVIMQRIVHDVAPRLSTDGGVSEDLADLVARVLARDPQERFQTARDFARALERVPIELFDEEETGKLVLELFPETLTA